MQYDEAFSDLASVYLEDSWVLDLAPSDSGLTFRLEAVLTPAHALYEPASPGEQHCYRTAWLSVRSQRPIEVHLSGNPPATDATGGVDLGHIDAFVFNPTDDHWDLEGNWGTARVRSPLVALRFD